MNFDERLDTSPSDGGVLRHHPYAPTRPLLPLSDKQPTPVFHHDQWLTARSGSPLAILAADIWSRLEAATPRTSTRQPRTDALERRKAIVANILANLAVVAVEHPQGHRLAISAEKDATTRYDRKELPTAQFLKSVSRMCELGLIDRRAGISRKLQTTLTASRALLEAFDSSGVSLADIARAPGGESIILKADMGRRMPKRLLSYRDCPEADRMRAEMATINQALNAADIRLDGIRQLSTHMVRIFQVPGPDAPQAFNQYGRLYHGFWQDLRRARRRGLTINGESLCDLDFRAAFVSIAYAWTGATAPQGDPYSVPGLERHRAGAKQAISSMFFLEGGIRRLSPELRGLLPEGWSGRQLAAAIEQHHPGIAPLLGTNCGPGLTFAESNILVAVLLRLISEGIVALGCHDGLLVGVSHRQAAIAAMGEVSRDMLGVALEVVEKRL